MRSRTLAVLSGPVSEPAANEHGDTDVGEEAGGQSITPGCDAPEAFQAAGYAQHSLRMLAKGHGINPKTVTMWQQRTATPDRPTGPKEPNSTVLSVLDEAVFVAARRHPLPPLDDRAAARCYEDVQWRSQCAGVIPPPPEPRQHDRRHTPWGAEVRRQLLASRALSSSTRGDGKLAVWWWEK